MSDSIHRSNVHLGVDATEFVRGVNDSAAAWKRFQKQAEQAMQNVSTARERYDRRMEQIRLMEEKLPHMGGETAARMRAQAELQYQQEVLKEMEQRAQEARVREEYAERAQGDRSRRARELDTKHYVYMQEVKARAVADHMKQVEAANTEAANREAYMQGWLARRKAAQAKHDEQMRIAQHQANINRLYAEGDVAQRVAQQTAAASGPGGMNRYSAVAMQAGFAVEDFAAQVGPMGIAGGLRAAANNLSMIAFTMGGPLHGAIIGITAALAGSFIGAWQNSTKAVQDFNSEAQRSIDIANQLRELQDQQTAATQKRLDVDNMGADEVKKSLEENAKASLENSKKLERAQQDIAENQRKVFEAMMGGQEQSQIADNLINTIKRQGMVGVGNTLQELQSNIYKSLSSGNKEALEKAINDWNAYVSDPAIVAEIGGAERAVFGKNNPFTDYINGIDIDTDKLQEVADNAFKLYAEAASAQQAVDEAQMMHNKLVERELELREKLKEVVRQTAIESNVSSRVQLNNLMSAIKEEAVTMNMTKAQKLVYDYQKRRNELMAEAAMLGDEELTRADAMMTRLLQAEEQRVLAEMNDAKTQQKVFDGGVITQTGSGTNAASQAMADAMKQFMDRGNRPEDKNARMLQAELRAIRDLLSNPNAVRVGN